MKGNTEETSVIEQDNGSVSLSDHSESPQFSHNCFSTYGNGDDNRITQVPVTT